jgi:hypothetical protein
LTRGSVAVWFVASNLTNHCLNYAVPILVAASFAMILRLLNEEWERQGPRDAQWVTPPTSAVAGMGLLWGLVAGPRDLIYYGVHAPLGAFLFAVLLPHILETREIHISTKLVNPSDLKNSDTARSILDHGPAGSWTGNARWAVEMGAVIGILPLAYFMWEALMSLGSLSQEAQLTSSLVQPQSLTGATLVASVLIEGIRWLLTAAVFGLLYPHLPGRTGPSKVTVLAALWFGVASFIEVANRLGGYGSDRAWTFRGLQLVLFLLVLSIAYDYATMTAARGGRIELAAAYRIESTRQFLTFAVPAALAALAIAQQVANGTGSEFVRSVIESLPKIVLPGM